MTGLLMDYRLTLTHILERAAKVYPGREIAHVLDALGLQPGERVDSLCWNGYRHLELYFAGPAPAA
jgi:fatty-acyl-CoA synthase